MFPPSLISCLRYQLRYFQVRKHPYFRQFQRKRKLWCRRCDQTRLLLIYKTAFKIISLRVFFILSICPVSPSGIYSSFSHRLCCYRQQRKRKHFRVELRGRDFSLRVERAQKIPYTKLISQTSCLLMQKFIQQQKRKACLKL